MPGSQQTGVLRKAIVVLLVAETTLIIARMCGSVVLPLYDDAFITFRYASNLAAGLGLVYHANEWVLGVTCPLFAFLISLLHLLELPVLDAAVVMNIALDVIVLLVTFMILTRAGRPLAAVLFGALFALSPIMTRICVGGMEANLFLLCCVGSVALYRRKGRALAVALAAVSYYIRPEAVLLVAVLLGEDVISHWGAPGARRRVMWLAVLALAIAVPPLFAMHHYYGKILPHSVLAKSASDSAPFLSVLRRLVAPDPLCLAAIPFAAWGLATVIRQRGFVRTCAVFSVVYVCAYLVARPHMWSWYGEPVHYAGFVLAGVGGADLAGRLFRRGVPLKWISVAGGIVVVGIWLAVVAMVGPTSVRRDIYRPLQQWCRQDDLSNSSILAEDIGAIGYFSNARILDTAGLIWPEALASRSIRKLIETHMPEYVFLNLSSSNMRMMSGEPLGSRYERIKTFSMRDSNSSGPFKPKTKWRQEYMLFRKLHARDEPAAGQ